MSAELRSIACEIGDQLRPPDFQSNPDGNQWAIDWVEQRLTEHFRETLRLARIGRFIEDCRPSTEFIGAVNVPFGVKARQEIATAGWLLSAALAAAGEPPEAT